MSGIHFNNWDDGSVAVESATVHISASRLGTPRAFMSTTIAVDPAYLHHVGRPETEDAYGIETIRAALAAKVAADFPDGENPVETSVEIEYRLDAVGPRREDGGRMPSGDWVDLAVPCSREEADAAREKLSMSVIDGLDAAAKYFAAEAAESAAEIVAARIRADA